MKPLDIVVYANGPNIPTGFGTVVREVFTAMLQRRNVPIGALNFFAINYDGSPHGMPFNIWPAQVASTRDPDLFGRSRFIAMMLQGTWPCDVLFVLEDHFTVATPVATPRGMEPFLPALVSLMREQVARGQRPPFKVVEYIPVDGDTLYPSWVSWMPDHVDFPVSYTQFGRRVLLDHEPRLASTLRVIPHGTSPDVFHPISADERRETRRQMGLTDSDILISNINRNQPRKDIPSTLNVFREVFAMHPNARLYCHMNAVDSAGYNLGNLVHQLRLPQHSVIFPMNFSEGAGVPLDLLNRVYNATDIYLTTARGEGWGLPLTEAMTVGVPCVAPRHTSYAEILADGRGVLVDPLPHRTVMTFDNDVMRPQADVMKMATAISELIQRPERRTAIGQCAREWALAHTWRDHVAPLWEDVFAGCSAGAPDTKTAPASPTTMPVPSFRPVGNRFAINAHA